MSDQVLLERLENRVADDDLSVKCWLQLSQKDELIYLFQVETSSKRRLNKAISTLDGCVTANGFDPGKGKLIVITRKVFSSRKDFEKFRAMCPLKIELT